jgi:hypothetical protein
MRDIRMVMVSHVCPVLGRIKALDSFGLSTDLSAGVAGSVAIEPATPPNRGVIGRTGVTDRRGFVLVAKRQFSHGTGAAG